MKSFSFLIKAIKVISLIFIFFLIIGLPNLPYFNILFESDNLLLVLKTLSILLLSLIILAVASLFLFSHPSFKLMTLILILLGTALLFVIIKKEVLAELMGISIYSALILMIVEKITSLK